MKIKGQLEDAQLHNKSVDPTNPAAGLIWIKTDTNEVKYKDADGDTRLVVEESLPQTLTNKTLDANLNTILTEASGNLAATELNAALNELQIDIDSRALQTTLNTTASGLQAQIDELALDSDLQAHLNDTTDAHDASAISVVATGNIASTNVQSALVELQDDINAANTNIGSLGTILNTKASAAALGSLSTLVDTKAPISTTVTLSGAQTVTNKTLSNPIIDVATLDGQADKPSNPPGGFYKLYVDDATSKLSILDSAGTVTSVGAGGSGGGKNYIPNPDFEGDGEFVAPKGWTKMTTTLNGAVPTGTPTFTGASVLAFVARPTEKLAGTKSLFAGNVSGKWLAGQGFCTDPMPIDRNDLGRMMQFRFSYEVIEGEGNSNFVGNSNNHFIIYIYDEINNAWIQPTGCFSMSQGIGPGKASGEFQVPVNTTSLRLAIIARYEATSTAINFDEFSMSPTVYSHGVPVTDWQPYSPIISGFGTPTLVSFWERRVGSNQEVQFVFQAGTVAATTASFTLPLLRQATSLSAASYSKVGEYDSNQGTTKAGTLTCFPNLNIITFAPTGSTTTAATGASAATTSAIITGRLSVPIAGWSSSLQLSDASATRIVAAKYTTTATASIGNAVFTMIDFGAKQHDTYAAVLGAGGGNTTTAGSGWRYVVPVAGIYTISASMGVTGGGGWAPGESIIVALYKNGVESDRLARNIVQVAHGQAMSVAGTTTVNCLAGDVLQIGFYQDSGAALGMNGNSQYVDIQRIAGPESIAATETVACRYTSTSGQSYPAGTPITVAFATKDYDTHGQANVAPVSGKYDVMARISWNETAAQPVVFAELKVDGTSKHTCYYRTYQTGSVAGVYTLQMNDTFHLQAGQSVTVTFSNTTAGTLSTAANQTIFVMKRVGN